MIYYLFKTRKKQQQKKKLTAVKINKKTIDMN